MEANRMSAERVETADVYSDAAIYERDGERKREMRDRMLAVTSCSSILLSKFTYT